ncbi:MAG: SIR2 family protein [Zoogloea sp.]|nr:SIR2 family protein [Zoogloea sp.]
MPADLLEALSSGRLIPYLGPRVLALCPEYGVPATPEDLVAKLVAKASVPHKIRSRLTQSAQFIENFKHRKTLVGLMREAFAAKPVPGALHTALAGLGLPLIVDAWYDNASFAALQAVAPEGSWGMVQGLSQSEHFGTWTGWYDGAGLPVPEADAGWKTILYKPIGGAAPADNYLVSDTDYVEVLTEIDIQTPIPAEVQAIRTGRSFLFLGCRFNDQLPRSFARQIMKRSSDVHWAVLPDEPTRMEEKFLAEQNIRRIDMPLADFVAALLTHLQGQPA